MATLKDYLDKGVMEPEKFFSVYGNLPQEGYKAKIIEMYGPTNGRDKNMEAMANAAVLAYVTRR